MLTTPPRPRSRLWRGSTPHYSHFLYAFGVSILVATVLCSSNVFLEKNLKLATNMAAAYQIYDKTLWQKLHFTQKQTDLDSDVQSVIDNCFHTRLNAVDVGWIIHYGCIYILNISNNQRPSNCCTLCWSTLFAFSSCHFQSAASAKLHGIFFCYSQVLRLGCPCHAR